MKFVGTFGLRQTCAVTGVMLGLAVFAAAPDAAQAATALKVPLSGPSACGGFPKADNGPYDYRYVRDRRLQIVEQFHFTPNVESLVSGNSTTYVGGELGFTLRAFPNHHRALIAMVRLGDKLKTPQPLGSSYSVECWLDRARRFAPDDSLVRLIFAGWLGRKDRLEEALAEMKVAEGLAAGSPMSIYNIGMVYLDLKQYPQALAHARQAYQMGVVQTRLRDGLKAAGQWREAEPAVGASVEPPASAASAASAP
ncbi:MAG TPA: tetratricopeptide repeat protein [Aquabacterium sp.]|nr:tetratricopeptide repeat protein [Aquabacterium sp.]